MGKTIFTPNIHFLRKAARISLRVLLSLLLLVIAIIGLLQTEWGQNLLVHTITSRLSKDLQSRISIKRVNLGLFTFNHMNLEGVLVEDQKHDTLVWAGTVQVRITDWFFFKAKPEIKYIGLENAVIKMQRTDSVWNYKYLEQYFASSPSTGKKKESGLDFNLKKVVLNNVIFIQKDAWVGSNMIVKVGAMDMDANDISLTTRVIDITSIALDSPYFHLFNYTGNRPDSLKKKKKPREIVPGEIRWNTAGWNVSIASITLDGGVFKNDRFTERPTYTYFDDKHIEFNTIKGRIKNFRWQQDTITAAVDLSTRERSGFTVQSLKAGYRLQPDLMEFTGLYLKTNQSVLGNYFAMKYKDIDSMSNFIHAVTMEGVFHNATVTTDDLAFFGPQIKDLKRTFKINGRVKGTVDDLSGRDLSLQAGPHTWFNGDVSIIGLPDVNNAFMDIKANRFRTTYADAAHLIPRLRRVTMPDLSSLEYVNFTGTYTGFFNDFVLYGRAQTKLGMLVTDLNMKLPKNRPPLYSGSLSTKDFQLGKFLKNNQLGVVAFDGKIRGKGFDWKTLDLNIDGNIHKIQYDKYAYQNIKVDGRLHKQTFDGDFTIKDPNADLHLKGMIDFKDKQPVFNANAEIAFANLKALQLSREDLVLKGIFDVNFTGKTLADFRGSARISKATLLQNGKPLSFDSLSVYSYSSEGVRHLRATSNEFDAAITGDFDLESLPDAFLLFLNRYYPSYIKPPRKAVPVQTFTFDITTRNVDDYIRMLDKRLSGFNNSTIAGSLDMTVNSLSMQADVPQFAFQNYRFFDIQIKGDGNMDRLKINGQINDAMVSDSVHFPLTKFQLEAANDISDFSIKTTSNKAINQAHLAARVQTFSNGFKLFLNPSSFVLNSKTWTLEEGGELDFRQNTVVHGQVVLRETNQEIRLSTEPSEEGDWSDLQVTLTNINLGDLTPLVLPSDRIEGLLSGEIHVEDPQHRMNVSADLRTEQLRFNNDSIGVVKVGGYYNNKTGMLTAAGGNADPEHQLTFDMAMDFKDSAKAHRDRITIQPINYPVKILERFIGFLFSDLQGYITGKLDILGEGANRDYVGKASLKNAGLKVNFTQVFYKIDDTQIELKADEINFGTMKLHDRWGNTATVRGNIKHRSWGNMEFDIMAQVDSRQMELLNTTYKDNQSFYGKVMGTGKLFLVGKQNDMLMNIEMTASRTDSSYVTLPPSRSRESGLADFMVEKKYGREMIGEDWRKAPSNMTYLVSLNANPMVNVEVILDELTADVIKGRGTGNLRITAGTNEPLTLRGRYNIQEGNYLYSFRSFFKKPLYLRPGANNYIEWRGDPYAANMHIEAVYKAESVSFAPLISGLALDRRLTGYRGDVNVIVILSDELFKPKINFQLEVLDNSILNIEPTLPFAIQQIEKNPNELSKQVSGLIVFNSFYPYEATQGASFRPFDEFAYSTLSGLLFGEVNKRLNELLSKILRNNEGLTVNFSGSVYNRNLIDQSSRGFNINQSNFDISVGVPVINNRFSITFGSTFDVPLQSSIQQTVQFLPDVTAEWVINKSGTIRASFFYRQNLDYISGTTAGVGLRTKRTGANISYRREYDNLNEFIFGRRKKKDEKVSPVLEPGKPYEIPDVKR